MSREYLYKSCQDLLGSNAPTRQERLLDLKKNGVGNARVTVFFPPIDGSICIRREGRAEDNFKNAGVDL